MTRFSITIAPGGNIFFPKNSFIGVFGSVAILLGESWPFFSLCGDQGKLA